MYINQNMFMPNAYFPVCHDLPQKLLKAMQGERDARLYYQQLLNMTPSDEDREIISHFFEDEGKHYANFSRLYMQLTGRQPVLPPPQAPHIPSYIEGVKQSIFDETDAYEFYRDTYLCTNNPIAKEIFFEAMTDENEHAIRLNYLYTKNK